MKKKLIFAAIVLMVALIVTGVVCYSWDGDVTLYRVGDNETTMVVKESEVADWTCAYEWSVEPTTLMYTEDGRQSWIWHSEVGKYEEMGWSVNPPVMIFGVNGATRMVLLERKQDYLDTGIWFSTYEEANPAIFTYNPFQKSNLTVDQLNTILAGTGLTGYGQAFHEMEQTYGVNALFCLAVGAHESANFYKTANYNNFFGFRGNRGWMSFTTPKACIMYFGQLMNTRLYYGKSIDQIAPIYCNASWAGYIRRHMTEKWSKLSI
jgi:hypothetical protein